MRDISNQVLKKTLAFTTGHEKNRTSRILPEIEMMRNDGLHKYNYAFWPYPVPIAN